jgi:N-acetylglucosaminyl-diphospho-decaprenol L-rhamnosyltransferase
MTEAGPLRHVAAIVVHYGPWASTQRTLRSLSEAAPQVPVLLVDNSSSPPPWRHTGGPPGVRLLSPGKNLGYGAACNLAAREGAGEFLLLLNNDVELHPGAVEAMAGVLEREPRVAAVGPRLLDARGRPVRSIFRAPTPRRVLFENLFLPRLFPGIPFFHGHHTVLTSHGRAREVETLSGAALLVRRKAFEDVGGFDEAFFFYAEESDLFARLARAGWRVRFEPSAGVIHHGGVASAGVAQEELDRMLHEGLRLYARRHHGQRGERRTARALRWGAWLRWALAHLSPGDRGRRRRRRYADIRRLSASR